MVFAPYVISLAIFAIALVKLDDLGLEQIAALGCLIAIVIGFLWGFGAVLVDQWLENSELGRAWLKGLEFGGEV